MYYICVVYVYGLFPHKNSSRALVIVIKSKAEENVRMGAILLFYVLLISKAPFVEGKNITLEVTSRQM